jgi:phosphoribosyl 1,2-cyclic phosphodiesterase
MTAVTTATNDFSVKFWGVRGSIPSPGAHTVRYGGNTTSLEIHCGDQLLAIDGGTGVRLFGDSLMSRMPIRANILMTHLHLDHVQGFPFFTPFLVPGNRFDIWSARHSQGGNSSGGVGIEEMLRQLFNQPAFPISMDMLKAELHFHTLEPGDTLQFGDLKVRTALLHHPGGSVGYRLEYQGRTFAHCSDWEHPADGSQDQTLIELVRDADLLSIDATYTEDEYAGRVGPARRGWGHSTHTSALAHADAAKVRNTLLFHHDPSRTDDHLDEVARTLLADRRDVRFVAEGQVFQIGQPLMLPARPAVAGFPDV